MTAVVERLVAPHVARRRARALGRICSTLRAAGLVAARAVRDVEQVDEATWSIFTTDGTVQVRVDDVADPLARGRLRIDLALAVDTTAPDPYPVREPLEFLSSVTGTDVVGVELLAGIWILQLGDGRRWALGSPANVSTPGALGAVLRQLGRPPDKRVGSRIVDGVTAALETAHRYHQGDQP